MLANNSSVPHRRGHERANKHTGIEFLRCKNKKNRIETVTRAQGKGCVGMHACSYETTHAHPTHQTGGSHVLLDIHILTTIYRRIGCTTPISILLRCSVCIGPNPNGNNTEHCLLIALTLLERYLESSMSACTIQQLRPAMNKYTRERLRLGLSRTRNSALEMYSF